MTKKERKVVELLLEWHKQHRRLFPWRVNPDPYRVLVAEVLLQRTPANRVAKLFPEFVERFPDPRSVSLADLNYLRDLLQPMGLKKRAGWLLKLMSELCQKYGCRVPDSERELLSLPGVGLYTARAVLSFGFRRDMAVVDVNVARVLSRVFGLTRGDRRPSGDKDMWTFAAKLIPKKLGPHFNEALLDFAASICKNNPSCAKSPLINLCTYYVSKRRSEE